MSDNRNFDGPSAVERGQVWGQDLLSTRMGDLGSRRQAMTSLKGMQADLQKKAFDLSADGYGEEAQLAAQAADVYGQQGESMLPRYQDAQGFTNFAESVQDPNEMYDPARARMKNNADIYTSLKNRQADQYEDPITAANRENVKKMDELLMQHQLPSPTGGTPTFTWNGRQYSRQELQDMRNSINTKGIQEQFDEQLTSLKQGKTNPYAEENMQKMTDWQVNQENRLWQQAQKMKKVNNWTDAEMNDYYQQQLPELEQRAVQYESFLNKNAEKLWEASLGEEMKGFINNKLAPTYQQYLKQATTRGAVRNNIPVKR
jgi:hypothetical protein